MGPAAREGHVHGEARMWMFSAGRIALRISRTAVRNYLADSGIFLASGLAFDLLLCLTPLLLVIVSLLGYLVPGSEAAARGLEGVLDVLAPESRQVVMDNVAAVVANRGLLGVVGFVLFFLFGSLVFGSARLVLNTVFRVEQRRSFLKGKLVDFLIMLGAGVLFLLAIATSWLLTLLRELGEALPWLQALVRPGWQALSDLVGFLFTLALFYLLYRFSPARTIRPWALVLASVTGACLFHLSKWAFGLYVDFARGYAPVYGAIGGLLFFFLWLYYACTVFILGAEVGWAYDQRKVD